MRQFDAIIIGGGMVGMASAIALADEGLHVAVIESIPAPRQLEEKFDGRVCAISLGSKRLLASLGVWERMLPSAEPILDIRVMDGASPFFLHYDHETVGNEPFGWIVENRHTRAALFARAEDFTDHITVFAPAKASRFSTQGAQAHVVLDDGRELIAALLLIADGRMSQSREQAGIKAVTIPYHQTAIVCTIAHSKPHNGLALERFLPVGPFAVLPMQHNRSSLVWTESTERAKLLLSLGEADLIEEIERRVGGYLGDIHLTSPCFSYPLTLVHAERYTTHRIALIGDTAHGIHPLAGQGVNLGFRDVAVLAEVVGEAHGLGLDIGTQMALSRYSRWRSFDALSMTATMHVLNILFSNNILPFLLGRKLGLAIVDHMPFAKRFFMRHAMGLVGDLPKRMQ